MDQKDKNNPLDEIEVEMVDLEEHANKHGTAAPRAKQYAFRVDRERVVVTTPKITGKEILAKVGKTPDKYKLYQHRKGHQPILIPPDHTVDLREKGVERFTTMPKDTTEGRDGDPSLRRDFRLPESDEAYLNDLGLQWETFLDGQTRWLIILDWVLPQGYYHSKTAVGLQIPQNYSDSQIDMVYFKDHLARTDGKPIGALCGQLIGSANWQRWSRHRSGVNPWRPGVDDIASHLTLVDEWLRREFEK